MVPGACGGWLALLERYGDMDLADIFKPAIELAENGYAVTVKNADFMAGAAPNFAPTARKVIMARGRTPLPGEVMVQKDLARTFRRVIEGGKEAFYHGDIAKEIARFSRENDGLISEKIWRILKCGGRPRFRDLIKSMTSTARRRRAPDSNIFKR